MFVVTSPNLGVVGAGRRPTEPPDPPAMGVGSDVVAGRQVAGRTARAKPDARRGEAPAGQL